MPKISEERKTERRTQILDGARRAFSEHGYEGATVARLEDAVGLSRGAIFNYFSSKEELFVELAVQDSARLSELWVDQGLAAVVREVLELDAAWLGVYLELIRRVRTDPDFRRRIEERQQELAPVNRARVVEAQQSGEFRDDIAAKDLGAFVNLVLNGLALQRAQGDDPPSPDLVVGLLEDAIGGRAPNGRRLRRPA
jgi:TetR/AcrR family transcriptional regulator, transcriptional repressor of aconitase